MSRWITLTSFTYPHEAYIAQGYLDSEGIETIIQDELTTQVHNFYSNAIGGVKIQVRDTDYDKGLKALNSGGFISDEYFDTKPNIELVTKNLFTDKLSCPFCKSRNIGKRKEPNVLMIFIYFIFGALFPIFKRSFKCYDCDKEWKYVR